MAGSLRAMTLDSAEDTFGRWWEFSPPALFGGTRTDTTTLPELETMVSSTLSDFGMILLAVLIDRVRGRDTNGYS